MWIVVALVLGQLIALPPQTPIPCLVCKVESQPTATFSGTVQQVTATTIAVFNLKSRQTMAFEVPAGFHGVQSSDGKIKDALLARVPPGLLARVTYRTLTDRRVVTEVLLLTINQCRSLVAAERLNAAPVDCPD